MSDQTAAGHLHVTAGYTQTNMHSCILNEYLRQKMFSAGQNLGTWNIMPGFTKGMHTIMRTFKLDCFSMCEGMKIISKMYL